MEKENNTMSLLDDVMNQSMDDVECAPEFIMPPSGRYVLAINEAKLEEFSWVDEKTKEAKSAVSAKIVYSVIETKETSDPNAVQVPKGTLFGESVSLDFEGKSPLKTYLEKFFGEDVKNFTFAEGVSALVGIQLECIVRVKANKKGFDNAKTSQQTVIA